MKCNECLYYYSYCPGGSDGNMVGLPDSPASCGHKSCKSYFKTDSCPYYIKKLSNRSLQEKVAKLENWINDIKKKVCEKGKAKTKNMNYCPYCGKYINIKQKLKGGIKNKIKNLVRKLFPSNNDHPLVGAIKGGFWYIIFFLGFCLLGNLCFG